MAHGGRARGEMGGGGHQRAVWEQQNVEWFPLFSSLKTYLAGDEGGGMGGGVGRLAHGGRARGEMGGGHQRAVWEQQNVHWFPFCTP